MKLMCLLEFVFLGDEAFYVSKIDQICSTFNELLRSKS